MGKKFGITTTTNFLPSFCGEILDKVGDDVMIFVVVVVVVVSVSSSSVLLSLLLQATCLDS